jgi:large subunit ribosomal protein L31
MTNNKGQTTKDKLVKTMPKPDIHPTWYPEAKVICNGEVIMTIGSTKPEIHVEVWSGNHPFYTGTQKIIDTEGRVDRFLRKYGMLENQAEPATKETAKASSKKEPKKEK